ncbi:MAG: hypothetical protein ICV55_08630, partial [Coleofasciculus sp. C3-bin4]|nr:hypothetical protein [Coleofasciculus sp. C3-bin4]
MGRWQTRASGMGTLLVGITPLALMLSSCQVSNFDSLGSWSTYHNQRYNFKFPYPSNWVSVPMPDNGDGRAFRDPQNPTTEIRGWAANQLPESVAPRSSKGLYEGRH